MFEDSRAILIGIYGDKMSLGCFWTSKLGHFIARDSRYVHFIFKAEAWVFPDFRSTPQITLFQHHEKPIP